MPSDDVIDEHLIGDEPADDGQADAGQVDAGQVDDAQAVDDAPLDDGDYVYLPPEHSMLRRAIYAVAGVLAVIIAVTALGGWWVLRQIDPPGGPGEAVTLTIPTGSSTSQIGTLLENKGVITSAVVFQYYVKFKDAGPFKAGDYDGLTLNDSMSNVVNRLKKGPLPPVTRTITIPEGLWVSDIRAKILETFPEMDPAELDTALATVRSKYQPDGVTSLEGLLFPATYEVSKGDEVDEQKLVQQMVSKFEEVGDSIGLDQAQDKVGLSPYQVITMASMIEREAKLPDDRPKIARVIHNRLSADQRLEIDASLEYALGVKGAPLTASQLKSDSPYNLRKVAGLPPTPIGAPGQSSLEAALTPADGDWLYYVLADATGAHYFTADYNDFLDAKKKAQREGLLGG
ncbi:MAG: endolytic transglycosylase MltG [Acidimicrobiales bacterium]